MPSARRRGASSRRRESPSLPVRAWRTRFPGRASRSPGERGCRPRPTARGCPYLRARIFETRERRASGRGATRERCCAGLRSRGGGRPATECFRDRAARPPPRTEHRPRHRAGSGVARAIGARLRRRKWPRRAVHHEGLPLDRAVSRRAPGRPDRHAGDVREEEERPRSESEVFQPQQEYVEPGFARPPQEDGKVVASREEDECLNGRQAPDCDRPGTPSPHLRWTARAHDRKIWSSRRPRSSSRISAARSKSSSFAAAFIDFSSSVMRLAIDGASGRSGLEIGDVTS